MTITSATAAPHIQARLTFACHLVAFPRLKAGIVEAGRLGFAGVEAFSDAVLPYGDRVGGAADLAAMAGASGVRIAAIYHDLSVDDDRREKSMDRAHRAIELLAAIHGDRLVVTVGPAGIPVSVTAGALEELGAEARSRGIAVCVHPHAGSAVFGHGDLAAVLAATHPDHVLWCADTGHLHAAGENPADVILRHAGRLGHVHLKDVHGPPAFEVCALGDGVVDIGGVLASLDAVGYAGWAVVEVEHRDPAVAAAAVRASRAHLLRAGRWAVERSR